MAKEAKDDKGKGKKEASPDGVMAIGQLRPLLKLAKNGKPMGCAVCLSGEGEGVIFIDKKAKGRKLRGLLTKKAEEAGLEIDEKSIRYGRASVTDAEPTILKLVVNKEPSGSALHAQLRRRVKPAGFTDILVTADASVENDVDDDEQAASPAPAAAGHAAAAAPPPAASAPAGAAAAPATAAAPPAGGGQPSAPQQAGANPAAEAMARLGSRLGQLVPKIKEAIPEQQAALSQLAMDATKQVKELARDATQLAGATALVDRLEAALKAAAGGNGQATAGGAEGRNAAVSKATAAAVAKSHTAWAETRKAVKGKLDTLQSKMAEAYKDHGFGADLDKYFKSKLEPMTEQFDEELNHVLADLGKSTDPGEKKKLVVQAETIRKRYETYLKGEKLIKKLDENPFVPNLGIGPMLTTSLSTIGKTLASISNSLG